MCQTQCKPAKAIAWVNALSSAHQKFNVWTGPWNTYSLSNIESQLRDLGISNYVHVYSEKELLEHNYNEERGKSKNIESKLEIGKYLQWNGPIEIYDNKLCSLKCLSCLLIWLQPLLSIIRAMRETWEWLVSRTKQCRSQQRPLLLLANRTFQVLHLV